MKNRKKIISIILIICSIISIGLKVEGHSGRTDSNGGHRDSKNISGLGSYHYHCGGNPAHLHTNGACPYSSNKQQSKSSTERTKTKSITKSTTTQSKNDIITKSTQTKSSTTDATTQSKNITTKTQVQNENKKSSSNTEEKNREKTTSDTIVATGIQINETIENLKIGESKILTATVTPSNTTDKTITWKTSNDKIATVNSSGKIIAKKSGKVEIIATTSNGITSSREINIEEEQRNTNDFSVNTLSTKNVDASNNTSSKKQNSNPIGVILALGLIGGGSYGGYKIYRKLKQS